jgi:hypothetical protein
MQHAEGLMETWEAETPVENRNSGSFYYYPWRDLRSRKEESNAGD